MWILHLKRLILENHPAKIPAKVKAPHPLTAPSLLTGGINRDTTSSRLLLHLPQHLCPLLTFLSCALISVTHNHFSISSCAFGHLQVETSDCSPLILVTERVHCYYIEATC